MGDGHGDRSCEQGLELHGLALGFGISGGAEETPQILRDLTEGFADQESRGVHRIGDLDRRVEIRAAPVALVLQPLRGGLEEQQDLIARPSTRRLRPCAGALEPARLWVAQPGHDQVVLGWEVPIERCLGDTGGLDDGIDPGRLDPVLLEQRGRRAKQAIAGRLPRRTAVRAKHAADERDRVGGDDAGDRTGRMAVEVIRADHDIRDAAQVLVDGALVGQQRTCRLIVLRPFGAPDEPRSRIAKPPALLEGVADVLHLGDAIERAAADVRVCPGPHLELPGCCRRVHVDAGGLQARQEAVPQRRIDDLEGTVTLLDTLDDEWQQQPVRLVRPVQQRAHVMVLPDLLTGEPDRRRRGGHVGPPRCGRPTRGFLENPSLSQQATPT